MNSPNVSDKFEYPWPDYHYDGQGDSSGCREDHPVTQEITSNRRKKIRLAISSSDDDDSSNDDPVQEKKINFQAAVHEKNFKGQKSFEKRGVMKVQGDTEDDVLKQIWTFCKQFITKAVAFKSVEQGSSKTPPTAMWSEDEPAFESMDQFMAFQDKSGKRTILPSNVTSNTLQSWLEKTITIIVYRYSDTVSSAQKFNAVESQLLRPVEKDRAGAESITSLELLKTTLKSKHGNRLVADDINWSCWANYISTKPMTEREDLTNQLPPRHLIGLFRSTPIHSDTILTKTKLDLRIAENENKAYKRIVCQLKDDHLNLARAVEVMGNRIAELEGYLDHHNDMISAMRSTVVVQDDEYTSSLAERVPDCVDVDHE